MALATIEQIEQIHIITKERIRAMDLRPILSHMECVRACAGTNKKAAIGAVLAATKIVKRLDDLDEQSFLNGEFLLLSEVIPTIVEARASTNRLLNTSHSTLAELVDKTFRGFSFHVIQWHFQTDDALINTSIKSMNKVSDFKHWLSLVERFIKHASVFEFHFLFDDLIRMNDEELGITLAYLRSLPREQTEQRENASLKIDGAEYAEPTMKKREWTSTEILKLKYGVEDGKTLEELAKSLSGRTENAVNAKIRALGLKLKNSPGRPSKKSVGK